MKMKKTMVRIAGLAAVLLFLTAAQVWAVYSKIDPALVMMKQEGANLEAAKAKGIVKSVSYSAEPVVNALLKFDGDLTGVEYYGAKVHSIIGNIATVEIPLSAIDQIAQLPNVTYIEAARKLRPRLDVSVPATGADSLWGGTPPNTTGYTGHNVVIGIVDTGLDLHHRDFKKTTGKTRVLSLWDQTATSVAHPTGIECTSAVINAGTCSETDTYGHGTHVAGIAAGNGSATGNSQAAYRYIGMAPEADLIIVKTDFTTTGILNGIDYIQTKAAALGKPCVINLSLGSHSGPHDGTSLYEQGLDSASGAGKVIVGAAGNEATAAIHASGTVPGGGGTITVNFTVPSGTTLEVLDLWTAGTNTLGITVSHAGCTASVAVPDDTELDVSTSCGVIGIISSLTPNANNGDREILIGLWNGSSALAPGAWTFTLRGTNVPTNGRFDVWATYETATFDSPDPTSTLVDTSTATKTISVASYNTKGSWNSLAGGPVSYSVYSGDGTISVFSSIGPRRSCTGGILTCPTIRKPEITAPGMGIMSSLSANTIWPPNPGDPYYPNDWIDPDGVHRIDQGTSMATPHVTGAVALLLQRDPAQTSDQIKTILFNGANADIITGGVPNNTWGYGKLNALASFTTLSSTAPAAPAPATPTGLSAAATATDALTLTWTANTETYLNGYKLYRGLNSGGTYTAVVTSSPLRFDTTSYTDTGLTLDTAYYYVLTAVNYGGVESGLSSEATGTATTITLPIAVLGSGSSGGGGGGCFIATAAYGSYLDPHVKTLRDFRDNVLLRSEWGRLFVEFYYTVSPPVAGVISGSPALRFVTRLALTPVVLLVEYPRLGALLALMMLATVGAVVIRHRRSPREENNA